jgi:predicted transcriptional regulator
MNWTLNKTEIRILQELLGQDLAIGGISEKVNASLSWTSDCVSHLNEMGFVDLIRSGRSKIVHLSGNRMGESIRILISQNRNLDLNSVLADSGLKILPYLLSDGSTMKEISEWALLSYRMVQTYMKKWSSMGVAYRKKDGYCVLNPRMRDLIHFVKEFSRNNNRWYLRTIISEGIILWEESKEFLFVSSVPIEVDTILKAGPTFLSDQGFDIISDRFYYKYSIKRDPLSIEEALVQTIVIDPVNPRPRRLIFKALRDGDIQRDILLKEAKNYGIERDVSKIGD